MWRGQQNALSLTIQYDDTLCKKETDFTNFTNIAYAMTIPQTCKLIYLLMVPAMSSYLKLDLTETGILFAFVNATN